MDRRNLACALYSKPTRSIGIEGCLMNRLMLFAVLLFQSTAVFFQSTATPFGSPQVPGKVFILQLPFDFSNGQPGKTVAKPTFKSFDCPDLNATQNQVSVPIDLDHLFNASCTDLKSHVELFARNESPFSRTPLVLRPHPKGGPIPTQWPNAKIEQIPTQWPNLKLQPIGEESPGSVPAHSSAK